MSDNGVKLRREVFKSDAWKIIYWLEDDAVTEHLNEKQNVDKSIKQIIYRIDMPILTHLFNQNGSFFLVTTDEKGAVGFLRLVPKKKGVEIVVVIGDKKEWDKGLGTAAIFQGLKYAFFTWRVNQVIAKISIKNKRSQRVFKKVGFTKDKELSREIQYSITIEEFLELVS